MPRLQLQSIPILIALAALTGCGSASSLTSQSVANLKAELEQRQKEHAELVAQRANWDVECSDDHHGTAERRCSAKNGNYLMVVFVDGRGPYLQAGLHWHPDPDKASVVRVDDGPVRIVGKSKDMLPADAVVKEMLRGTTAYATCYNWPYGTPVHTVNSLAGFKEAYGRLLEMKSARPPRPTPISGT